MTEATQEGPGRPTKFTPELRRDLVIALQLTTDVKACETVGIGETTLNDWLRRSRAGDAEYRGFSQEVQRARGLRRDSIMVRLATYATERGDDMYLKHTKDRDLLPAKRRKAEAEARMAEARAALAEKVLGGEGEGGSYVAGVEDLLELLPDNIREPLERWIMAHEMTRLSYRRDILEKADEGVEGDE